MIGPSLHLPSRGQVLSFCNCIACLQFGFGAVLLWFGVLFSIGLVQDCFIVHDDVNNIMFYCVGLGPPDDPSKG